jgi:hypothetical protein
MDPLAALVRSDEECAGSVRNRPEVAEVAGLKSTGLPGHAHAVHLPSYDVEVADHERCDLHHSSGQSQTLQADQ